MPSPTEREKRDRRDSRGDEREGQGRKGNRNESEETEEIKSLQECSRTTNSAMQNPIWLNFELVRILLPVLVPCKSDKDPIKNYRNKKPETLYSLTLKDKKLCYGKSNLTDI